MGEKLTEELGEESFRKFTFDTIHEFEGKDYRKEREKGRNFSSIARLYSKLFFTPQIIPAEHPIELPKRKVGFAVNALCVVSKSLSCCIGSFSKTACSLRLSILSS